MPCPKEFLSQILFIMLDLTGQDEYKYLKHNVMEIKGPISANSNNMEHGRKISQEAIANAHGFLKIRYKAIHYNFKIYVTKCFSSLLWITET